MNSAELSANQKDTNRLNWLEDNNAKIEPRFGKSDWIGIFWGGHDCGGHTLRDAIDAAMKKQSSLQKITFPPPGRRL